MRKAAVLMLAIFVGCASRGSGPKAAIDRAGPRVSVMTFNVNFGMAGDAETVNAIAKQDVDVIFLQETNRAWQASLRYALRETHPHSAFQHGPAAGGLGVLSRMPIDSVDYLPAADWFPAARVVLTTSMGKLQVLNVHLRPPVSNSGSVIRGYLSTPPVRRAEIQTFTKKLDPSLPTLIVGDFNENENGQALRWLARHREMKSALPQFEPDARTWRWKTYGITLHNRYDHLVYDKRLVPLHAEVRKIGRSDHLPVVGVFALSAERAQ